MYAETCPHGSGRGKRPRIFFGPEPYLSPYPGAKSQGMKQFVAGAGVALVGISIVPLLAGLFTV